MRTFSPTQAQVDQYGRDGYLIVEQLLDPDEFDLLSNIARADRAIWDEVRGRRDGGGTAIQLTVHNELGDDIYSAVARCRRVAGTMERLLGGEVYHYHHKMILKEPHAAGAWEWHQDYGYWYNNACLLPELASCMIAVDRATRRNGCLQVIKGSHHMGRVDHRKVGDQTGADPERVAVALERMELVYCELAPGSAVFFHCNLLHRSDRNSSDEPRWALICCYNTARNDPYKQSRHPRYRRLDQWDDERVAEVGRRQWESLQRIEAAPSEPV